MTPTIGRIVHYHYGAQGEHILPAIITKVHNATRVDLEVFGPYGSLDDRLQSSVCQGTGSCDWSWPPRS